MENEDKKIKKEEIIKNTKKAEKDIFLEYAPYLIIIFFIVIIRMFICTPVRVSGTSMTPTLQNGNIMLLYKLTKKYRGINRFDIVVIDNESGRLIKRVIALPGDKIRYEVKKDENGEKLAILYINDEVVEESFLDIDHKVKTCDIYSVICETNYTVPEGEYFVMGDNRGNSKDSRTIGTIKEEYIIGTAKFVIFPLNKFGNVE